MQKLHFLFILALFLPQYADGIYCYIGPPNHRRFEWTPSDRCRYLVLYEHVRDNMIVGTAQGSGASIRTADRIKLENMNVHQCQHRANGPFGRDIGCECFHSACNWKIREELYSGKVNVQWVTHLDLD